MHPILLYLLKMILCSGILYGYYRVALYNEKFHQWNRFYLLAALGLSVVIPFLEISVAPETPPTALVFVLESLPAQYIAPQKTVFTTENILGALALSVSLFLLLRMVIGFWQSIYRPYRQGHITPLQEVSIILTNEKAAPYSFFQWLFWRQDMDPDTTHGKRVLIHELTHIRELHSIDKLFAELLLIVCWFNPFFWLIKKELYLIHEFLADRRAIENNNGAAFAEMILRSIHNDLPVALASPLFTSQLKRRLKMITTSNKPQFSYLRRLSALIAMVGVSLLLMLTIEQSMAQQAPPPPPPPPAPKALPDSIKSIRVNKADGKETVTIQLKNGIVRKMTLKEAIKKGYPVFPPPPPPPPAPPAPPAPPHPPVAGFSKEIQSVDIYQEKGIDMVKVVTQKGEVKKMTLEQAHKNGYLLAPPAPPAPPVPPASKAEGYKITGKGYKLTGTNDPTDEPLYVYAGLIISKAQMAQIDPNNIEPIDVLKGESAIAAYGDKGKNGVIKITPKNADYSHNTPTVLLKDVVVVGYGPKNAQPASQEKTRINLKSIDGKNAPLYVLDGKVISEEEMNAVDPNHIESISVLKDESATKAYGSKGQNGVVLIATKLKGSVSDKIFTKTEQQAVFPGGHEGWIRHLQKNLRYPDKAIDKGTQGKASIQFLVDKAGNLSDFKILENPGDGLGEEALRVIKEGPKWEPAEQNDKKVIARVVQVVTFRLE